MRRIVNHSINFFWTIIAFYPLIDYWCSSGIDRWFIIALGFSISFAFLPKRIYNFLRISDNPNFYKKLGVRAIRKFVQNGDFVKKLSGQEENTIVTRKHDAEKYLTEIEMYHRFHWVCFIFFTFSTIHAIFMGKVLAAMVISLLNILYNITAILLQQYNKTRIERILKSRVKMK